MEKLNVVIVDDNRSTSTIIKENLLMEFSSNNYDVNVSIFDTTNGIVESTVLNANFLIMDYNLEEDVNGIVLAEQLVNKGFKGKVLLITGEGGLIVKAKLKFSNLKKDQIYYLEKNDTLLEKIFDIIDNSYINK